MKDSIVNRAIGIARQSRGDEASQSVESQVERIRDRAEREGWELLAVHEERDVSGGRPLAKRPGLLAAVEAVEAGKASIVVVAYFDRLVRSMAVQLEVVSRIEQAGGRIVALDIGDVSHATATSELTAGFLGQVAQYHRTATKERVRAAHETKIANGEWCGGRAIPFGMKLEDGKLVESEHAETLREAFRLRAGGATFEAIRAMLRERTGMEWKSVSQVQRMLQNPVYLGRLQHGDLVNEAAHPPVVDRALFRAVGAVHSKRGPRPASERLLARLGVLRCATCDSRMVVHGSEPNKTYRCGGSSCARKAAISCHLAEDFVSTVAKAWVWERQGKSGADLSALEAQLAEKRRHQEAVAMRLNSSSLAKLDTVVSALEVGQAEIDALEDEPARAREQAGVTIVGADAWETMDTAQKRRAIAATIDRVEVRPGGRGQSRMTASTYTDPYSRADKVLDEVAGELVAVAS
jgi:site-specific DNA recombinase